MIKDNEFEINSGPDQVPENRVLQPLQETGQLTFKTISRPAFVVS